MRHALNTKEPKMFKVSKKKITFGEGHRFLDGFPVAANASATFKSSKEVLALTRNLEVQPQDILGLYTREYKSYSLAFEDRYFCPIVPEYDVNCGFEHVNNLNGEFSQSSKLNETNETSRYFNDITVASSRDDKGESTEPHNFINEAQEKELIGFTKKACSTERDNSTKNKRPLMIKNYARFLQKNQICLDYLLCSLSLLHGIDRHSDTLVPLFWKPSNMRRCNTLTSPVGDLQPLQASAEHSEKEELTLGSVFDVLRAPINSKKRIIHTCTSCGKIFDRPSSLKVHKNTHTGTKPYVCQFEYCGRKFSVHSNMKRHYKLHFR